jgi:hypothetical protein
MAKKAPAKPAAKRKPAAKKPVVPAVPIVDPTDYGTPIEFPAWLVMGLKAVSLFVLGSLGGIWAAGGIDVSPGPGPTVNDCLSQSHAADRVSQVRILREYAGKSFPDEPTAQSWLNAQRIEARKNDWIPYTDELGAAADSGVDAVKALADKLGGKR